MKAYGLFLAVGVCLEPHSLADNRTIGFFLVQGMSEISGLALERFRRGMFVLVRAWEAMLGS